MTRHLTLCVTAVAIATTIAVLGVPGESSAASGPVCGNATGTVSHCLVEAQQPSYNGQPIITAMAGIFTVPKQLAVKAPAYSIGQIALWGGSTGANDIELGWIVDPAEYHGSKVPHLFVFFRRSEYGLGQGPVCQEGLVVGSENPLCPSSDYVKLSSKYSAGMPLQGPSALFYVGYDSTDNYWYIQYQDQYIAKMSAKWWTDCGILSQCSTFEGGDDADWYGEVYTPSNTGGYACTPMGNGKYGSGAGSATVADMEYGTGGPTLVTATPLMLPPTYPQYWNTNRTADQDFSSSFSFGGPGDC
jgi:hypothetical protein